MNKEVFILCVCFCFLWSCEKPIEYSVSDVETDVVLYSFPMPDSALWIHVSKSVNIVSMNDFNRLHTGQVRVYEDDTYLSSYTLSDDTTWLLAKGVKVKVGMKYAVIYQNDDLKKEVKGEAYVPRPVLINSIDTSSVSLLTSVLAKNYYLIKTHFVDESNVDNYYQLILKVLTLNELGVVVQSEKVDVLKTDNVFNLNDKDLSLFEGVDFQGLFNDEIFDGKTYGVECVIPKRYLSLDDPTHSKVLVVELYSLSESYYLYARSRIISEFYENIPIFDPVKVYSNIENGIGLFGALAVDKDSIVFDN